MAYFLKSDGINQYVNLASAVAIASGQDFEIEIDMQAIDGADFGIRVFGRSGTTAGRCIINKGDNGNFTTDLLITGIGAGKNIINRNVINFKRVSNLVSGLVNGDPMNSTNTISSGLTFQWLLSESSATNARNPLNLYSMKVWIAGVLTHHWDPSVSNGTGTTLIDVVGGNNGTLINYASDADAWEFYSSGTTPIAFTGTIPTQSFTVGESVSVDLSGYFSGTETPFTFANTGTALTGSGLSISSSGLLSGTAAESSITGVVVTGTDADTNTAVSNSFSVTVSEPTTGNTFSITDTLTSVTTAMSVTYAAQDTGTITIPNWANNTGTALPNLTGITVNVRSLLDGSTIYRTTSATTDAGSNCVVSDATIVAGTSYEVTALKFNGVDYDIGIAIITAT